MNLAKALGCPQCGAQLARADKACDHCGASVRFSAKTGAFSAIGVSCPACHAANAPKDKHCGNCGEVIQTTCRTPNCHQVNSIVREFCSKCGRNLGTSRSEAELAELAQASERADYHRSEIVTFQDRLNSAEVRHQSNRVAFVGGGVAIAIVTSLLFETVGAAFIVAIGTLIAWTMFSGSDEIVNLRRTLAMHEQDLRRAEKILAELGEQG